MSDWNGALSSCENMGDDLAALKAYGDEFTDLGSLTKMVAKNWLLHKRGIKKDIAQEETDWAAGNYFAAGEDTYSALDLLVPYKPVTPTVDMSAMAIPDFIAGFMFELTGDNDMTEIEACFQGSETMVTDAEAALADIEAGDIIKGAKAFE